MVIMIRKTIIMIVYEIIATMQGIKLVNIPTPPGSVSKPDPQPYFSLKTAPAPD